LEDLGVDERIILKWMLKKLVGSVDWSHVTQHRDQWHGLVNTVTVTVGFYKRLGI
jgi:hypothetical protein